MRVMDAVNEAVADTQLIHKFVFRQSGAVSLVLLERTLRCSPISLATRYQPKHQPTHHLPIRVPADLSTYALIYLPNYPLTHVAT